MQKRIIYHAKNAGSYFVSSLVVALIGIVLNPIFASHLSHKDYAIIGFYSSFTSLLLPLLHLKMYGYYTRQYYYVTEGKREELASTVLLTSTILGFGVLILFLFGVYGLVSKERGQFPFFPYAILTFSQVYFSNIITFYQSKLRIQRKARQFSILSIINCVVTSLFSLLLVVYFQYGAMGKLAGALFSTMIFAVYSFRRSISIYKINWQIFKEALNFSWPLVISTVLFYFYSGIDRLLLEPLGDIRQYGLYSVGLSISSYLGIFFTTLSNTFLPDLFQSIANRDYKKLALVNLVVLGGTTFCNLCFVVLAPIVIDLLTAGRYVDATPYARILSIHNISLAIFYMIENVMIGIGYTKQNLVIKIIGVVFSVFMYVKFIDMWQFVGAAWGQVFSFVLLSLMSIAYIFFKQRKKMVLYESKN